MCYLCRINVKLKHSKNCFVRERTEKVTVMTKKQNFHHIKRRIFDSEISFFFDIGTKKISYSSSKNTKVMDFETIKTFFRISDIKK